MVNTLIALFIGTLDSTTCNRNIGSMTRAVADDSIVVALDGSVVHGQLGRLGTRLAFLSKSDGGIGFCSALDGASSSFAGIGHGEVSAAEHHDDTACKCSFALILDGLAIQVECHLLANLNLFVSVDVSKQSEGLSCRCGGNSLCQRLVLHIVDLGDVADGIDELVVLINLNIVGANATVIHLNETAEDPSAV